MTEKELIQKLAEKDGPAFRYLVENHQQRIFRVCLGFLHHKEDAEDITQDVFIEIFRSAEKFRGESKISTWLYRIAVNKSLNLIQKKKVEKFFSSIQTLIGLKEPKTDKEPHHLLENKERSQRIKHAINKLPDNQGIAYTLAKYDDLSYQEIAEIMNISVSSVESLLHRAKLNLQKKLLNYYKESH